MSPIAAMDEKEVAQNELKDVLTKFKQKRPLLLVLSGPSGVGKDAVIEGLRKCHDLHTVVTTTTRALRPGETDGNPYYFVSKSKFEKMIENDELLEWAKVYDYYYGVPREEVNKALKKSETVIIKVDVQGARTIKNLIQDATFIFLLPSSPAELSRRLQHRGSMSQEQFRLRLKTVSEEVNYISLFDYAVINADNRLDQTITAINCIIIAEKSRIEPRNIKL
jgi:guanylate kinase